MKTIVLTLALTLASVAHAADDAKGVITLVNKPVRVSQGESYVKLAQVLCVDNKPFLVIYALNSYQVTVTRIEPGRCKQ